MKENKENPRKFWQNKWLMVGIGSVLFVIGCLLFPQVTNEEGRLNFVMAFLVLLCLIGGGGIIYFAFKMQAYSGGLFQSTALKVKTYTGKNKPNTILLMAKKTDEGRVEPIGIKFIYLKKPIGQLHKLENTNEYFYFNIIDPEKKKLFSLILPDTMYLDPRKYVIPLTMPADKEFWKPFPNPWEKVSLIALVVVIVIEWRAAITLG